MTADYKADLYTASLTLGNPDLIHGTGVAVFHYLRAITKQLSLGAEFAYQVMGPSYRFREKAWTSYFFGQSLGFPASSWGSRRRSFRGRPLSD